MKHPALRLIPFFLCLLLAGCVSSPVGKPVAAAASPAQASSEETSIAALERDTIYQLLAYAIVHKNWQTLSARDEGSRGHNIGCVLVDPKGQLVDWARNCNGFMKNGTQHGETRVMWHFQGEHHLYDLKGYTIYTTLEPCAMCSGMMIQQKVSRTVYGQTDLDFGKAIERLQYAGGPFPKPYPRSPDIKSEPARNDFRQRIDSAFLEYVNRTQKSDVTAWLITPEAKNLYQEATNALLMFTVNFPENQNVLDAAKAMYSAAQPEQGP